MYKYNNEYMQPQFEQSYRDEYEMGAGNEFENEYELDPEFDLETDNEMESDNEFENDYESNHQYESSNYETESNNEFENDYEFDPEYEGPQDEMEAELEYVTNEEEFSNWVNEVVVRDHRRLRPILRTPLGRKAIKQFSKIAFKTLPYIGRRRPGWRRPGWKRPYYKRRNIPGYRPWQYGPAWGSNFAIPPQNGGSSQQSQPLQNSDGQQQPQIQQDGSFKNFVLDTIKNLSEQIARGNESIMALKNSMTNSAVNNFPAIVQPKTDNPDQPAPNTQPPQADTKPKDPANPGEFEWEDYEYNNETDSEITDNEGSFNEITQMELASELLSVNTERELDQFFSKVFKKVTGNFQGTPEPMAGELLKKLLKKVAKKVLPVLGTAAGTVIGGPLGAQIGGQLGTAASNMFELELEGLSHEDSEFEVAKAIIRLAGNAAKEVHDNETGNPVKDAEHAMILASQRFAPGLIQVRNQRYDRPNYIGTETGTWHRRGNKIIIEGVF